MTKNYFPKDYADSRIQFRTSAASAQLGEWPIPSQIDADLFVDHAYYPPTQRPETLFVVTSGIHGSESYAGAAIQQLLLCDILPRVDRRKIGFFIVHAMNPYGFKHHQRTTENGVNLNRNFSPSGKIYSFVNSASDAIHARFMVRAPVQSMRSPLFESLSFRKGTAFFGDVSLDQMVKAIAPGQFQHADHLEFGGTGLEPQSRCLIERLRELMPEYQDIIAFDLHTGLGEQNRLHLLSSGSGLDLHPELFAKILHPSEDQEFYLHTPATEEGFYEVYGSLNSAFVEIASPAQRVCAITMEFGTTGHSLEARLESLNLSVIAHQGKFFGFAKEADRARTEKELFAHSYPQNDHWRAAVLRQSEGIFTRALGRINGLL